MNATAFLFFGLMVGGFVGYAVGAYKKSREHVDFAPLLDAVRRHRDDPDVARRARLAYDKSVRRAASGGVGVMALYVDVRVNDKVVAQAAVQNVTDVGDVCDYKGRAESRPFSERGPMSHALEVLGHDRRKSVWLLVAKMALQLARKEMSKL